MTLQQEDILRDQEEARLNKLLSKTYGFEVFQSQDNYDTFCFSVKTELEAYKATYKNQEHRSRVKFLSHVDMWRVTIFKNEFQKKLYVSKIS